MDASFEDGFHAGRLEERVTEHDRRLNAINGSIDKNAAATLALRDDLNAFRVDTAKLATRVGVYAAVAAFVAGVLGSVAAGVVVVMLTQR